MTFQEQAAFAMDGIFKLNQTIMVYLIIVVLFVAYFLINILIDFYYYIYIVDNWIDKPIAMSVFESYNKITHNTKIELAWTLTPTLILFIIAVPSFYLLYSLDSSYFAMYTLKAMGHQWYWSYESTEFSKYLTLSTIETLGVSIRVAKSIGSPFAFDSYLVNETDLNLGDLRLLEVTEFPVLPLDVNFNILVSSSDVLHSFAVPRFGIKIDAVPGRLNQVHVKPTLTGIFYGQCSELCGVGHAFMPIVIQISDFIENETGVFEE